mgnify:CR=1 FL=1
MNQSSTWKWVLAIIIIALVIWGLSSWGGKENPADAAIGLDETTELTVAEPLADDVVESPLAVAGEAVGSWYFEANFPIKLIDADGRVLAESPATAEEEWTTEEMVSFTASLEFDPAGAELGYLLFGKANPSDLPVGEEWVKLPVRFAVAEELSLDDETATEDGGEAPDEMVVEPLATPAVVSTPITSPAPVAIGPMNVMVFFTKADLAGVTGAECTQVAAVTRAVPRMVAVARAALNELLKGPAAGEISQGWLTSLPQGVKLQSLTINGGVARADFSAELNAGGSCRVASIRAQITETLKQFPTVSAVIISVNGSVAEALRP